MLLSRRQAMLAAGAALLGPAAARAFDLGRFANKKVLFFTKSSGFQHSAITRKGDELAYAEKLLQKIGKEHNFDVTCSKDGTMFDPDKVGQWDAFVFYTTGDLTKAGTDGQPPISADGLSAFLNAIQSGKAGFVGVHSATDTLGDHRKLGASDPYTQMIGGQFNGHGEQQEVELIVADHSFPGTKELPERIKMKDEWYSQKYQPKDLHAILVHDTKTMKGDDYKRPNYPQTWIKPYGSGRVFHTSMGHREDVWDNPVFQGLVLGGLMFVTGQVEADMTPNCDKVCPDFQTVEK